MNKKIIDYIKRYGKKVLFHCYKKHNESFPSVCENVSKFLTIMMVKNKNIVSKYTINCIRGHFQKGSKFCNCREEQQLMSQGVHEHDCEKCSSYLIDHHWIELVNKETNKKYIIDFTSIQFNKDIDNIREKMSKANYKTEIRLLNFIEKYNLLIFDTTNDWYKYYILDNKVIDGQELFNETRELYSQEQRNEIIDLFDYMDMDLQHILQ